jgi:cytochrome c oxidase assembly factor CtaG
VTVGTGSARSLPFEPEHGSTGRSALLLTALVLLVVSLVPPVAIVARRYEAAEAIQFCLLAVAIPALAVMGAPWRRLGLAGRPVPGPDDETTAGTTSPKGPVDRLAEGRRRHPEVWRSAGFFALFLAGAVLWRTPPAVNGLARHPWLAAVEAVTLVPVGMGLWLELVESPPLSPRLSRPHRVALAAVSMWLIWVLAYLVGLSHVSWYHAYAHHPGSGLSLSADQQLTTGMMWFISGCAFIPVVFWNLVRWLQSEEDPDEELYHLVRQERIRGRTVEGGPATP